MQFFLPLLTTLFIYLKLVGSITWSWWWVLSPLWLGFTTALVIILGIHYLTKAYVK